MPFNSMSVESAFDDVTSCTCRAYLLGHIDVSVSRPGHHTQVVWCEYVPPEALYLGGSV